MTLRLLTAIFGLIALGALPASRLDRPDTTPAHDRATAHPPSALDMGPGASSASAEIEVVLTEGTNMAAALSPDGGTLAVDLLGRIWTLPADGGRATPITDPFGDARQPQWSPDGRRIAFQAYWAGDYDVWVVNPDGSGLEQLTSGPFDDREPTWSPDGGRVLFSSDRGGSYDIWELTVSTGDLRRRTDDPGNEYTPSYAPDGRRIAYVTDGEASGVWVQDGPSGPRRLVAVEDAEAYSPSWSPDGRRIAFVRIGSGASGMHAVDAEGPAQASGETRLTDAGQDVFPFRPAWTGDGRVLYTADGGVRFRPSEGGREAAVDFTAVVTLYRPAYRKRLRSFDDPGPRPVRGIVSPTLSPDGSTVVFAALGDLWSMRIGSSPERLTDDPFVEVDPAFSPDGTRLVYASDREGGVDLYVREVATGAERRLTSDGGSMPVWSPDGTEIAFAGGDGPDAGLRVLDVATGEIRTVRSGLNSPGRPTWSPDGRHIAVSALRRYSTRYREGVNRALLIPASPVISEEDAAPALDVHAGHGWTDTGSVPGPGTGTHVQDGERWLDFAPHGSFASRGTDGPVWSPDGKLMAYVGSGVLWVVPVSPDGDPIGPARRLNNEQSSDPSWAGDSRSILYLTTDRLRRVWIESGRIEDAPVPLTWSRSTPSDRYTVHAGGVFDGVGAALRRNLDIVIRDNRIVRVVEHDPVLHEGRVVDASNGVVMPGLVEMHMHGGLGGGEHVGRQWLSFGVTTVRTPAADPYETVEARESGAAGRRIEPRMFGTGNTIDGSRIYYAEAPALTSHGQIELAMEQADALSLDVLKTYVRLPDAVQRRVIEEAHALGMPVTSHELYPAVAYGADGVEHVKGTSRRGYSPKVSELNRSYQDVVALLASSGMTITPTVGIYGGYAVLAADDPTILDDERTRVFGLRSLAGGRGGGDMDVRRRLVRDMASVGRRVVEEGGTVVVGTDSPIYPQGLSLVAEMQILVEYGGMAPIDVLRATTSIPVREMGYGHELGRVAEGFLADLVVLGSDPSRDIRAVRDVRLVIADGRVHTLGDLLGPR